MCHKDGRQGLRTYRFSHRFIDLLYVWRKKPNIRKTIGLGDIVALKKEYLSISRDKKTSPEYILSKLYTECKDGRNCKKNDRFVFGKRGALDHLVHCANMDPNEAADILALALKILH
jgi:hypothetical protein